MLVLFTLYIFQTKKLFQAAQPDEQTQFQDDAAAGNNTALACSSFYFLSLKWDFNRVVFD